MADAVPMLTACYTNQTKGYYVGECAGCSETFGDGWASLAGWHGICGLCAIKVELGLMGRPHVRSFWDSYE